MDDGRAKICEQWYLTLVAHRDNRPHYERDSVDLILSSRPSRGTDANQVNQQKLITVRSHTENYRQSYSIRTVKGWNSLPQSVVSAGSLALFKSRLTSHVAP